LLKVKMHPAERVFHLIIILYQLNGYENYWTGTVP